MSYVSCDICGDSGCELCCGEMRDHYLRVMQEKRIARGAPMDSTAEARTVLAVLIMRTREIRPGKPAVLDALRTRNSGGERWNKEPAGRMWGVMRSWKNLYRERRKPVGTVQTRIGKEPLYGA